MGGSKTTIIYANKTESKIEETNTEKRETCRKEERELLQMNGTPTPTELSAADRAAIASVGSASPNDRSRTREGSKSTAPENEVHVSNPDNMKGGS